MNEQNPWDLTTKEIHEAMNNIPLIPTPITENLAITMSKSVSFYAQKKLLEYLITEFHYSEIQYVYQLPEEVLRNLKENFGVK